MLPDSSPWCQSSLQCSVYQFHWFISVSTFHLLSLNYRHTHTWFCTKRQSYQCHKNITRSKSLFQSAHRHTYGPNLHALLEVAGFFSIWGSTFSGLQCTLINSAVLMSWKCFEKHHLSHKVTQQNHCFSSSGGKHNLWQQKPYCLLQFLVCPRTDVGFVCEGTCENVHSHIKTVWHLHTCVRYHIPTFTTSFLWNLPSEASRSALLCKIRTDR